MLNVNGLNFPTKDTDWQVVLKNQTHGLLPLRNAPFWQRKTQP
jgi:hypothetical protein